MTRADRRAPGTVPVAPSEPPLDEDECHDRFSSLQMMLGQPTSKMPDEIKDAIRWAEDMKQAKGMS